MFGNEPIPVRSERTVIGFGNVLSFVATSVTLLVKNFQKDKNNPFRIHGTGPPHPGLVEGYADPGCPSWTAGKATCLQRCLEAEPYSPILPLRPKVWFGYLQSIHCEYFSGPSLLAPWHFEFSRIWILPGLALSLKKR